MWDKSVYLSVHLVQDTCSVSVCTIHAEHKYIKSYICKYTQLL